jgi:hypothetical protein
MKKRRTRRKRTQSKSRSQVSTERPPRTALVSRLRAQVRRVRAVLKRERAALKRERATLKRARAAVKRERATLKRVRKPREVPSKRVPLKPGRKRRQTDAARARRLPPRKKYHPTFRKFLRNPSAKRQRQYALIQVDIHDISPRKGGPSRKIIIPYALGYGTLKSVRSKWSPERVLGEFADERGISVHDARVLGYGALLPPKRRRGMTITTVKKKRVKKR